MKRYAYKRIDDPSDNELNALGEQGWRVCGVTVRDNASAYVSSKRMMPVVIMERELTVYDPNEGRL